MRATPVLLLVAVFLLAGCAPDTTEGPTDLDPLADQAERVAQLIDEQRPCEAVEAARTLASLADDERLDERVTRAVTTFASSATSTIECAPATPAPTSSPPPTGTNDDEAEDDERDGSDEEGEDDEGDDDGDDRKEGNDDDHPGEGKARGKPANPGRGNGND